MRKRLKTIALILAATLAVTVSVSKACKLCRKAKSSRGDQITFGQVAELGPQLSPDGKLLAFEYFPADRPNLPQVWVMERARGFQTARPLVDNANYNAEFSWSPDGRWISYICKSIADRPITSQIFKVRVADGTTLQLTHFEEGKTLGDSTSWSKDGLIAFEDNQDIYEVAELGGNPQELVEVGSKIHSLIPSEIRWSPDGSRLAFTGKEDKAGSEQSRIWMANVRDHTIEPVTESMWDGTPSWFDNDTLLFSRGFRDGQTKACVLCLKTGLIECVTKGSTDLSPWGDNRTSEVFVARDSKSGNNRNSQAFFAGFHLWRFKLAN